MHLRRGARTYPEANRRVGAEPAARLGSMVRGRPTNFAAQIIEIGGLSWENANFASIDLFSPLKTAGTCNQQKSTHKPAQCEQFRLKYIRIKACQYNSSKMGKALASQR
jgi:hypothetical protein